MWMCWLIYVACVLPLQWQQWSTAPPVISGQQTFQISSYFTTFGTSFTAASPPNSPNAKIVTSLFFNWWLRLLSLQIWYAVLLAVSMRLFYVVMGLFSWCLLSESRRSNFQRHGITTIIMTVVLYPNLAAVLTTQCISSLLNLYDISTDLQWLTVDLLLLGISHSLNRLYHPNKYRSWYLLLQRAEWLLLGWFTRSIYWRLSWTIKLILAEDPSLTHLYGWLYNYETDCTNPSSEEI